MASPFTNFAALTNEELTIWQRDVWKQGRNMAFVGQFLGSDANAMIHRVKELKKSEKGARAVMTLVADLEGDGVAGDRQLRGNEEAMKSYDQVIRMDQLRHANIHQGRMADQKSVVEFRENSRDVLAYWLADRWDQMAMLTLAGIAYTFKTDGGTRVGSQLADLEFAADVTAPTTNRHKRWDQATLSLLAGNTAAVTATDKISWEMLIKAKAFMKTQLIRPIRGEMGTARYNVLMHPLVRASLLLDAKFLAAYQNALERSKSNPLFKGEDVIYVDGLAIYEHNHVFNTLGATSGSKWGAGGAIDGSTVLFCGAQALGMADIGQPIWVEEGFDYENQQGISIAKIAGFLKPKFRAPNLTTTEDFGVLRVDVAI